VYLPLSTLQGVLHSPGEVNTYWIVSSSKDHAFIDRLNNRLEDTLGAHGAQVTTQVTTQVTYSAKQDNVAFNAKLTQSITVLGLVIVAISMVGLVNATTMGILEPTREIGTLRSIRARARDIRWIFCTEGLVVALFGWLLGLPLGVRARARDHRPDLLGRAHRPHVRHPDGEPRGDADRNDRAGAARVLAPVRRAVPFKPGEAIRYA
jgi:putative ABC transport system permease protein